MFNPERLVLARHRRGYKRPELGALVEKPARSIKLYEIGSAEPTDSMIERFAETLGFPVDFFHAPLSEALPENGASFRALSRMTARQRDAALAVGTLGMQLNKWIEERFDLPDSDIPVDLQPGLVEPAGAAALLRTRWGLGEAPIANMLHLLEVHGVRVFSLAEECREVDAFSFWNVSTPYVCLATYKSAERAIFDAAHELGHLVMHRNHAAPRGRPEETEADAFASNLLMPAADIAVHAPRNPSLRDLVIAKRRWRVSTAALNYRLHQLGYTSDWHYRELCIELSRVGRDRELEPLPHERSQVLEKVFAAMREEGVGRREIASEIHLYQPDFDALTFGLAFTAVDGAGESSAPSRPKLRIVI